MHIGFGVDKLFSEIAGYPNLVHTSVVVVASAGSFVFIANLSMVRQK